ncbi:unnamed protein product [Closterium sp. Naga37s-1]|nr:unnamed protein product [Closterium sp. Naga37s-1]
MGEGGRRGGGECKLFTFFDPSQVAGDVEQEASLLHVWQLSWLKAGWVPVVLRGEESIKEHGEYNEMLTRAVEGAGGLAMKPIVTRWLAVAAAGGGLFAHYDVINFGVPPPANCLIGPLSTYGDLFPFMLSGQPDDFARLAQARLPLPMQAAHPAPSITGVVSPRFRFPAVRGIVRCSPAALPLFLQPPILQVRYEEPQPPAAALPLQAAHSAALPLQAAHSAALPLQAAHSAALPLQAAHSAALPLQAAHSAALPLQAAHSAALPLQAAHSAALPLQAAHSAALPLQAAHSAALPLQAAHSAALPLQAAHSAALPLQAAHSAALPLQAAHSAALPLQAAHSAATSIYFLSHSLGHLHIAAPPSAPPSPPAPTTLSPPSPSSSPPSPSNLTFLLLPHHISLALATDYLSYSANPQNAPAWFKNLYPGMPVPAGVSNLEFLHALTHHLQSLPVNQEDLTTDNRLSRAVSRLLNVPLTAAPLAVATQKQTVAVARYDMAGDVVTVLQAALGFRIGRGEGEALENAVRAGWEATRPFASQVHGEVLDTILRRNHMDVRLLQAAGERVEEMLARAKLLDG